jgi:hypothetical protein
LFGLRGLIERMHWAVVANKLAKDELHRQDQNINAGAIQAHFVSKIVQRVSNELFFSAVQNY